MPNSRELTPGMQIESFILLKRVRSNPKAKYHLRKKWRVECVCGNRLTIPETYFTRPNPKASCGCIRKSIKTIYNREFRIWLMMHKRTEDPNHVGYKHYGARRIKVCEEWHKSNPKGFDNFIAFVGGAPSLKHSIDRIDNDYGYMPYHPITKERQVKWSTAKEQRANQRHNQPTTPMVPVKPISPSEARSLLTNLSGDDEPSQ